MVINIKSITRLASVFGKYEFAFEIMEGATVNDLIEKMKEQFGDEFSKLVEPSMGDSAAGGKREMLYMLNGVNINFLNQMDTVCNEGDELFFLPPLGGG